MELEAAVLADVEAYGRCPLADKVRSVEGTLWSTPLKPAAYQAACTAL